MTGATIRCLSHSANPAVEIWSWSSESNTRRRGTSSLHCHCARPANFWSWHAASNCGRALTMRLLFPLSYTSGAGAAIRTPVTDLRGPRSSYRATPAKTLEVAGRIALPMICFAGRCLAVLATPPHKLGAEGGTRTRGLDAGNVASCLIDFRMQRSARS